MKQFNVLEHGLVRNNETLNTKALQCLVNKVSSLGGGVIYFPRGSYTLSTVYLEDNITIYLAKGCTINGSLNLTDYDKDEKVDYPLYQDPSHSFFHCSLFVAEGKKNISILGLGKIDIRSIWDDDNSYRNFYHRAIKAIAFKNCDNIVFQDFGTYNATDLAIYFAGCNNVVCRNLKMRTYIDGISPDNSKNVLIENCKIEAGDDGIVLKSSYTLNKLDICDHIEVRDCFVKSRCNAVKFGTESNGGFKNIFVHDCELFDNRITGISVETVDGAIIENCSFKNINMKNCGSPLFVHIGTRMRGPKELSIGSIKNLTFENIKSTGPYKVYESIECNYDMYVKQTKKQFPGIYSKDVVAEPGTWQITPNLCGLKDHPIQDLVLKNCYFECDGGVKEYNKEVPEKASEYPEINCYGRTLPSYGLYFRYVNGLKLDNVTFKLLHDDSRPAIRKDEVIDK